MAVDIFAADDGVTGREVWLSNGTPQDTFRLKDIRPGANPSSPDSFVKSGAYVYFRAFDDTNGNSLWRTDGTVAGTILLKGSANIADRIVDLNGSVLFYGLDSASNTYGLFRSNGTVAGTTFIKTVDNYAGLTVAGTKAYFIASTGGTGSELWVTDGTAAGTGLVEDIIAGGAASDPQGLAALGNKVVFSANDGVNGREVWVSDGTAAGTFQLQNIFPGDISSSPDGFVSVGSKVFFEATDASDGRRLWATDGTAAGTIKLTTLALGRDPGVRVAFNGKLYFAGSDPTNGNGLFASDGTAAGTVFISAGTPFETPFVVGTKLMFYGDGSGGAGLYASSGVAGSAAVFLGGLTPQFTVVSGNRIFFRANSGGTGNELWVSDGTLAGTQLVKDTYPGAESANIENLTAYAGGVVFNAIDPVNGRELWFSDGTAAGTILAKDINPSVDSTPSTDLGQRVTLGSRSFFSAGDALHGRELWVSDGTPAGTSMVTEIRAGTNGSDPNSFLVAGGKVYFRAYDDTNGWRLYTTDGTAAGTIRLSDGAGGDPSNLIEYGGKLYYYGYNTPTNEFGLFQSSGTVAGTTFVKALSLNSYPVISNGKLVFSGYVDGSPFGLITSNGTAAGTTFIKQLSDFQYYATVGNKVFFQSPTAGNGQELWVTDGTAAGTVNLKDINPGTADANPRNQTAFGSNLVFTAYDPEHEREVWISNGTAAGTTLLKDVNATGNPTPTFDIYESVAVGTKVFLAASNQISGRELWVSDGTAAGTVQVKDIRLGSSSAEVQQLTVAGGKLFFRAYDDAVAGWRLFTSDGTEAGTVRLSDGVGGDPSNLVAFGGKLFYYGYNTPTNEYGLFQSTGTVAGTTFVKALGLNSYPIISNGKLVFSGYVDGNPFGLITSDGTAAGTTFIKQLSDFQFYATVGNKVFFQSPTAGNGQELWVTDGTAAGTINLKDINPGTADANPRNQTAFGAKLLFTADDIDRSREVWISDGTVAGTTLLKDVNPIPNPTASFTISESVVIGTTVFMAASDEKLGRELWKSDGTVAGTTLVKDLRLGTSSAEVQQLTVAGGKLFFKAFDDGIGWRLYTSDGTAAGTVRLSDAAGGDPSNLVAFNGKLYFYGYNTPTNEFGLFESNGTVAGTSFVKSLSLNSFPLVANGKLVFSGYVDGSPFGLITSNGTAAGTTFIKQLSDFQYYVVVGTKVFFQSPTAGNGQELWVTDGTAAGTINLKDINPGTGDANPRDQTVVGNKLFFTADDGGTTGRELWVSDGTVAGTFALGDIYPGPTSSGPQNLTAAGTKVFFTAAEPVTGRELWVSDGTVGGTQLVKNIRAGSTDGNVQQLVAVGAMLYFVAYEDTNGWQVWKSDGTNAGTTIVTTAGFGNGIQNLTAFGTNVVFSQQVSGIANSLYSSDGTTTTLLKSNISSDSKVSVVGGRLYFRAYTDTDRFELWTTDGTPAGTIRLSSAEYAGASSPGDFIVAGTKAYFTANDGINGREVWVTDGTTPNTTLLKDINTTGDSQAQQFVAIGATLYFAAFEPANGWQVWKTNGTTAGTTVVTTTGYGFDIRNLTAVGTKVVFSQNVSGVGHALYVSDGTTTTLLQSNVFANGQNTVIGTKLYFQAYDDSNRYELWVTDGTAAGTMRLSDANIANGSDPQNFTVVGSKIFFSANDGVNGREIWVSDGTTAGTTLLKNIHAGAANSDPTQFVALGATLYFRAYDPTNGNQLWKSDGTAAGTVPVSTAAFGFDLQTLTVAGTSLYFYANIAGSGAGLYVSNGSSAPTLLSTSYFADGLTVADGKVYFRGFDGPHGYEYWVTDGTAAGTVRVTDASNPLSSNPGNGALVPNVPPTITAGVAGQATNDNANLSPFTTLVVGDIDRPVQTQLVTVTLDTAAKGVLTAASLAASGFAATATPGVYTFSGNSTAATSALQALVYDPANNRVSPGSTETTTFTVLVQDSAGATATTTASVVSTSINDAPTIGGAVAAQAITDKQTKTAFTGVTVGDVDNPAQVLNASVTLDVAAKGALTGFSSGAYNAATGVYSVSGSAAAVTTAIRSLVFDPTDNRVAPGTTETTTFRIAATDGIAATVQDLTTSVVSTSVNDAPTIAGAAAGQAITDKQTRTAFTGITVGDVDNPQQILTTSVTLDVAAKGALTGFTAGTYNAAAGQYTVSGTAAAVTTAIRSLVFDPTDNRVAPGLTETTTFRVATNDGLAPTVENLATTVVATSVNDAPTITGAVAGQAITDKQTRTPFGGVTIADPDTGQTQTVTVTLDTAAKGVLTGFGTGAYNAGTGVYSVTGSAAAVTTAVRSLVFDPTDNRVAPGGTETTTFTIATNDGVVGASSNTTTVVATSVNDPVTITGAVAGQAINDTQTRAAFAGITVADADNPGQTIYASVTLDTAAKGVLTGFSVGTYTAGTGVYSVSGTAAAVTTAIRSLVFDPTNNRVAPGTTDTTTFRVAANDGVSPSTQDLTTSVVTTSLNDAPTITGAVGGQAINDTQTQSAFAGVTVGDVDSPAQTIAASVTLDTAAKGVLTGFTTGAYDAGTGVYAISGTAAAVTAAIRSLVFDPTDNRVAPGSTETTTFRVAANDGGGGPSVENLTTTVVTTSLNDAPTVTGAVAGQTMTDKQTKALLTGVTIGDPDIGQTQTVTVTLDTAAKGILTGFSTGAYNAGTGIYSVTGSAAAVTTAVRSLVFDPTEDRVAPGLTETTTFTVATGDGVAAPVSNATTSVVTTSVGEGPIPVDDAASLNQRTSVSASVLTNDSTPPAGNANTVTQIAFGATTVAVPGGSSVPIVGAHGSLTIGSDGAYTYVANREGVLAVGQSAVDDFTYTMTEGSGPTATAHLRLTVTATATGDAGNNIFLLDAGGYTVDGLGGTDTASFANRSAAVAVTLNGAIAATVTVGGVNDGTVKNVENVIGGSGNDTLTGDGLANTLTGGAGNDTMTGGAGNDIFYVDSLGDRAIEFVSQGTDLVFSTVSYSLAAQHVENLTLTGSGNTVATGNSLLNTLVGNSGNNTIDGGTGNDTMSGGLGNDVFYVDAAGDVVIEMLSQGTDLVLSTVSYSLAGHHIENLTLTGSANTVATGNSLLNTLVGNSGNNTIDGGTGNDTVSGGLGNDVFYVDAAGDVVIEMLSQGTDLVLSTISYSLAGQHIENLTLTGSANTVATGNSLLNTLVGNSGNNTIDGGTGNDTMSGGLGNDVFYVDAAGDVVIEMLSQGTELVFSTISFSLAGQHIENLTLTGSGNTVATGNSLLNTLVGNSGNNTIDGGTANDTLAGGLGNDTLIGGAGADLFVFNTALGAANVDRVADYAVADDQIRLAASVFTGLAAGPLAATAFKDLATGAIDADDRILYNSTTGILAFDQDGSGAAAAVTFATFTTPPPTLTAAEFTVA